MDFPETPRCGVIKYGCWTMGNHWKSSVTCGYNGIIWDNMFLQSKIAIENPRTQWMCVLLGEKHRTMAGRFSSMPCLMTGRYTAANQKIKNENSKWFSSNIPAQSEVLHPFNNFFDLFEKSWKFAVPTHQTCGPPSGSRGVAEQRGGSAQIALNDLLSDRKFAKTD